MVNRQRFVQWVGCPDFELRRLEACGNQTGYRHFSRQNPSWVLTSWPPGDIVINARTGHRL